MGASSFSAPAGPAATTLVAVTARTASLIRCVAVACVAVQVIIWRSFYLAAPWRLAGPLVALAWGSAIVVALLRGRPGWKLACCDSGVHIALALTAAVWCVPPAMRGDTANWLFIMLAAQVVVPAWYAPAALSAPLAVAAASAYWAGVVRHSAVGAGRISLAADCAMLLTLSMVTWLGRRMLRLRAEAADARLAEADRDSRAQYVVLSRSIEQREHDRLLHDTVLNTLTALARGGGGPAEVLARCRDDVALMERALSDPVAAERPSGDLLAGIESVARSMRARGLKVHVEVANGAPASIGGPAGTGADPSGADAEARAVPLPVADAIVHAVREALSNVASHAGTGEAWVLVGPVAPAAGTAPGGLEVTVRDHGAGFDPACVPPGRLGLRRSITERVNDCGGQVVIRSAPGEGTAVCLRWTALADLHQAAPAGAAQAVPAGPRQAAAAGIGGTAGIGGQHVQPGRGGTVRAAYETELPRVAGMAAAVWQLSLLIQVLSYLHDYRQPAVPIAVWLGMLAAACWLVPRVRAGRFASKEALAAIAVAVIAVVLVGWERRAHGAAGTVDWSVIGTGWLLALVALTRPAWVWGSAALVVFAAHAVLTIHALGMTPIWMARLAATGYTVVVILVVFAAMRPAVRTYSAMAARQAELSSRSAAERAAAAAVHEDRLARLALLERQALPLLRGVAAGTLDPDSSGVREECRRQAAALRQALTDRSGHEDRLLAQMAPARSAARARGVPMEIRVVGDPGNPTVEVADATLAAVTGVVNALPPHPVTLTVLASHDDVEVFMTFEQPPRAAPDVAGLGRTVPAASGWHATVDIDDNGAGCLEIRWRKEVLA